MNFQLTHSLPRRCLVAVSGGVDSVSALHWLSQLEGRVAGVIHVNHNTGEFSREAEGFVRKLASEMKVDFFCRVLLRKALPGESLENHWREQRYRFFREISATENNLPVVVAHNMNDCLEEYVMCTMVRGFPGTIPYSHGPCIRPFRRWKREDIEDYAARNSLEFLTDPSNSDTRFKRNLIRSNLVPHLKELNPGIYKLVDRVISEQDEREKREKCLLVHKFIGP